MNYTLIVLLAYAVVMFGATVLMTKKEGNVERFCVGNRDIGWGISGASEEDREKRVKEAAVVARHMDMGAGAVHVNRERIHKGLCRALLVPGTECALPDTVHPFCKKDKGGNAGGDHSFRVYA